MLTLVTVVAPSAGHTRSRHSELPVCRIHIHPALAVLPSVFSPFLSTFPLTACHRLTYRHVEPRPFTHHFASRSASVPFSPLPSCQPMSRRQCDARRSDSTVAVLSISTSSTSARTTRVMRALPTRATRRAVTADVALAKVVMPTLVCDPSPGLELPSHYTSVFV